MLKRAVFGILGPSAAPRRPSDAATPVSRQISVRAKNPRRRQKTVNIPPVKETHESESEEASDVSEEFDGSEAESLSENGESETESNPAADPKVRRALIRRAAALYAEDSKSFLLAMQKHEQSGDEDEEGENDPELLDPESCDSEQEDAREQRKKGMKKEREMAVREDESAEDEGFKRGHFHCKLCPQKVFIFEADLEKHLESKVHKRREKRWEKLHQASQEGKAANEKTEAPERVSRSKTEAGRRGVKKESETKKRKSRRSERRKDAEALTPEEIQRRKKKFQRKKQRRLERKTSASAS